MKGFSKINPVIMKKLEISIVQVYVEKWMSLDYATLSLRFASSYLL